MEVKQLTDINKENVTMFLVDIEQTYNVSILENIRLDTYINSIILNDFVLELNEIEKIHFNLEYTPDLKKVMYVVLKIDFKKINSFFCKCYFTN